MSFPGGTQAEDKAHGAGWQIGLVRVRNDGRIEYGRGFQRVFGQEVRADQQLPLLGKLSIARQQLANLVEAFEEKSMDTPMPLSEFGKYLVQ